MLNHRNKPDDRINVWPEPDTVYIVDLFSDRILPGEKPVRELGTDNNYFSFIGPVLLVKQSPVQQRYPKRTKIIDRHDLAAQGRHIF